MAYRVLVGLMVLGLAGCNTFRLGASSHDFGDEGSEGRTTALVTDATERVVFNIRAQESKDYLGRIAPKALICAEPSPDVAQAFSTAISATIQASLAKVAEENKGISSGVALSSTESLVQLGSRIATIQLLRDELADLCRSFANGAVSSTTYTVRLSRLDKKMITLLMGEAAAGALTRALATIAGNTSAANSPTNKDDVKKVQNDIVNLGADVKRLQQEVADASTSEADKTKKQKEIEDKLGLLDQKNAELYLLMRSAANVSATGTPGVAPDKTPQAVGLTSTDLALLQRQFLDDDELGTIIDACISSLDIVRKSAPVTQGSGLATSLASLVQQRSEAQVKRDTLAAQLYEIERELRDADVMQRRSPPIGTQPSAPTKESVERIAKLEEQQKTLRTLMIAAEGAVRRIDDQMEVARLEVGSGIVSSRLDLWCFRKMDQILSIVESRDYARMRLQADLERVYNERTKNDGAFWTAQMNACVAALQRSDQPRQLIDFCNSLVAGERMTSRGR